MMAIGVVLLRFVLLVALLAFIGCLGIGYLANRAFEAYCDWVEEFLRENYEMTRVKETIEWIGVDERLPDDETTVMIEANGMTEPVWPGYHLNGRWYTVDGLGINPGCVTAWADMPVGPNRLNGAAA